MSNQKKVLVTGGAGFVGSHLCDLLISKEHEVVCVDNLITGSEENIKHLLKNKNFTFINHDITLPFNNPLLAIGDLGYIFHLASPASPVDYWNYPEETLMVNSQGTLNMLKLTRDWKAKFLLASTSEIYGDPLVHPQVETYFGNVNTFGPRACYDESKRFAETATYIYLHKYDVDARVIRIFNTYGPRMQKDDGRVVSNFIMWALANKDIKIDGDGSQTRSFCFVSDLVEGIYKAMFENGAKGEIFNLGNPNEFTILELSNKLIKLTNSKSKLELSPDFRKDDPMRRQPDISKAKKMLGWEPKVSLDEGLPRTIEYYKNLI